MGEDGDDEPFGEVIPLRGRRPTEDARIRELRENAGPPEMNEQLVLALLSRAERAFTERRYERVIADCNAAIQTCWAGAAVYQLASRAYMKLNRVREGARALERAVTMAPTDGELWAELALMRLDLGQHREAVDAAARGITLDPESGAAFAAFAEIGESIAGPMAAWERAFYYEQALAREERAVWIARRAVLLAESPLDRPEAVREVERALALAPEDFEVRLAYGCVLAASAADRDAPADTRARALAALAPLARERKKRPIEQQARLADALYDLHRSRGEAKKGFALLERVAEALDDPRRWIRLADAALECGKLREALFAAARASQSEEPEIMYRAARAFGDIGAWRAAEDLVTRYLAHEPGVPDAYLLRSRARFSRRRYKRGLEDLDRAVACARDQNAKLRALHERATRRLERGDVRGALRDHDTRVRIGGSGFELVQRGELWLSIYEKGGERSALARARRDFDRAARAGNADAHGFRAVAREVGGGDFAASCSDLQHAIEHGIGIRNWWTELSRLHAKYGRADEAATALENAQTARWPIEMEAEVRRRLQELE
jgi:tetratricopeptide (TPR) repeat protein